MASPALVRQLAVAKGVRITDDAPGVRERIKRGSLGTSGIMQDRRDRSARRLAAANDRIAVPTTREAMKVCMDAGDAVMKLSSRPLHL